MELFNPLTFASAKASSQDLLEDIAHNYIEKYLSPQHASAFIRACNKLDYTKANQILDKAIKVISGCSSTAAALAVFADKFPELNIELSDAFTERDKVQKLNANADSIFAAMKNQMSRRHKMESWIVAFIILFFIVAGVYIMLKNKGMQEVFSKAKKKNKIEYTEQDKDMLSLIRALSEVYRKTDEYLEK